MKASVVASVSLFALLVANPVQAKPRDHARERPRGHGLVVAGVALVSASLAAYVATAVGLGLGSRAEADLLSLRSEDEIEERRDVLARGRLGNRLAIGAGVSAIVLMAGGIPMIIVGRKRATEEQRPGQARAQPRVAVGVTPQARGAGATVTVRF